MFLIASTVLWLPHMKLINFDMATGLDEGKFWIRLSCTFICMTFKSYIKWSNAQHVNTPTTMTLPTTVGTFHSFDWFIHVIYVPQASTYQNIVKLLRHPHKMNHTWKKEVLKMESSQDFTWSKLLPSSQIMLSNLLNYLDYMSRALFPSFLAVIWAAFILFPNIASSLGWMLCYFLWTGYRKNWGKYSPEGFHFNTEPPHCTKEQCWHCLKSLWNWLFGLGNFCLCLHV